MHKENKQRFINGFCFGVGLIAAIAVGLLAIDIFSNHQHYNGLQNFFGVEGRPSDNIVSVPKSKEIVLEKLKTDGYILTQEGLLGAISDHYNSIVNLLILIVTLVTLLSVVIAFRLSISEARKMAIEEAEKVIFQENFLDSMKSKLEKTDIYQNTRALQDDLKSFLDSNTKFEDIDECLGMKDDINDILRRLDIIENQIQGRGTQLDILVPIQKSDIDTVASRNDSIVDGVIPSDVEIK